MADAPITRTAMTTLIGDSCAQHRPKSPKGLFFYGLARVLIQESDERVAARAL